MGKITFGPYLEQLRQTGVRGRRRYTDYYPRRTLFSVLKDLHEVAEDVGRQATGNLVAIANTVIEDIEGHLLGYRRPIDGWLRLRHAFTDHTFVNKNFVREMNPTFPHRLAVSARINKAGNLSVAISPRCLSQRGYLEHAPEWREEFACMIKTTSEFRGRPGDEVLYIGCADSVLNIARPLSAMTYFERRWHNAVAQAINFSFWNEIVRLRVNYEVHIGSYVAFMEDDTELDAVASLELVNAIDEHRDDIKERAISFKEDTGYDIDYFMEVCKETKVGLSFDRSSKVLRQGAGPARSLTPSVVSGYFDLAETACKYGFL
jgi:hypothetical protein